MTDLLSTEEAARQLGVTPGTLTVWRATRRYPLRFIKVGRKVRYRASDLEDFLEARTQSGTVEPQQDDRRRHGRASPRSE
jgi:excisionase family DNA binding protein